MKKTLPRLHLVGPLDGVVTPQDFIKIGGEAGKAGECAVHVRMPGAQGGDIFDVARHLKLALLGSSSQVLVNDRIDVAMAVNASGVQLGERSLPVSAARRILGTTKLIGRSVHDVAGAKQAVTDGADYLIVGHVFDTESKQGAPGRGLDWLHEMCISVAVPVVAIGGISLEHIDDVLEAGVWGVAVGRDILQAEAPGSRTTELLARIDEKAANTASYRKLTTEIPKWVAQ